MTLWEKTISNMQKGYERVAVFAAVLSDRVKAEIAIIRLRTQLDEVRSRIRDQHAFIGRKLAELRSRGAQAGSVEQFLRNDEIAAALDDISRLESDVLNIQDDLRSEANALKAVPPPSPDEEKAA
jgi:uncharacterized membrane protein